MLLALALGVGVSAAAALVRARPVPTGRYVEIPFGVATDHPWRTGGGDPRRTGRLRGLAPSEAPTRQWEAANIGSGQRVRTPTVARDGTVFVGSQSGLSMVGPDGAQRWALQVGLASGTPSFTPDGKVVLGAQGGRLLFVGGPRSRAEAEVGALVVGSPLALDDGSVVVPTGDPQLLRVDGEGRRVFETRLPGPARSQAALAGGSIVVAAGEGLHWFGLEGALERSVDLGEPVVLGPVVTDTGDVLALSRGGVLHRVGLAGGHDRSELDVRPAPTSALALAPDGSLRFGTLDAGLLCVEPDGSERWRLDDHGPMAGELSVDAGGTTLVVSGRRELLAVAADGRVRWSVSVGRRTFAAPVLGADGTIYVATFGGFLQAWR
ncbi:MAG: hypothetical protein CMN31_22305 [Sandaracinus sp.]|nr:hypothetical protein [Myxococcales bacterium]MAT25050.1 hypothetical protein [Sandaracinus sp.]MBJ74024.1 hypothetical protein [Sandaracinus sp.]